MPQGSRSGGGSGSGSEIPSSNEGCLIILVDVFNSAEVLPEAIDRCYNVFLVVPIWKNDRSPYSQPFFVVTLCTHFF